jgi:hypothetical protein
VGRLLRHHLQEELTNGPAAFAPCLLTCKAAFVFFQLGVAKFIVGTVVTVRVATEHWPNGARIRGMRSRLGVFTGLFVLVRGFELSAA